MVYSRIPVYPESEGQRRQETGWRRALENSPLGLWDWDPASGEMWWTQGMAALHGLRPDQAPRRFDAYMPYVASEDRERTQRAMIEAARAAEDFTVEYRVALPGGTVRWVECDGSPLPVRAPGKARHMMGLCLDVTRRRRIEEMAEGLAVPVLPIDRRILLLPLIGPIDAPRAAQIGRRLLPEIRRTRSRAVVFDLTGVSTITEEALDDLFDIVDAAKLLGAQPVLTGISSAVASAFVDVRLDARALIIERDLREGIRHARSLLA